MLSSSVPELRFFWLSYPMPAFPKSYFRKMLNKSTQGIATGYTTKGQLQVRSGKKCKKR
jgi:hypothetical protein